MAFSSPANLFTALFVAFLLVMIGIKAWLAWRQIRHVRAHADQVPPQFSAIITPQGHKQAARYTTVKQSLGLMEALVSAAVLLAFTLCGGLQWLMDHVPLVTSNPLLQGVVLVVCVSTLGSAAELPLNAYRQFKVEAAFGFNRMRARDFVADIGRSFLVGVVFGVPLAAAVLALMQAAGAAWWLYAWALWSVFFLAMHIIFPIFIAPLFNRFSPLPDGPLRQRVQKLLDRAGFTSQGIFTMDASRRSSHGNAYFTGLGRAKRVVFYDTLLERLSPEQIEAVLAHEIGHYKMRHVQKRLFWVLVISGALLATLGWLEQQEWFYLGLGVQRTVGGPNQAAALVLFALAAPVFSFLVAPLASVLSRKQEFEADRYAVEQTNAQDLVQALLTLYKDNSATLTPDPVHSAFYDSHPPPAIRVARLLAHAPS